MARMKQIPSKRKTEAAKLPAAAKVGKKTAVESGGAKPQQQRKKRRTRAGTAALRQIRHYQKNTQLLIPKLPFQRLVREIAQDYRDDLRFQRNALDALQEGAEAFLTEHLQGANEVALHAHRVTVFPGDLRLSNRLRNVGQGSLAASAVEVPAVLNQHVIHERPAAKPKKARAPKKSKADVSVPSAAAAAVVPTNEEEQYEAVVGEEEQEAIDE